MDRGRLLFEYAPPRAHPIVYAGMLLFAVVLATGSLENLLRENRPVIYAVYSAPLLLTLGFYVLFFPSTIRIHEHGIAPSRPLVARWFRPFVAFDDVQAMYPSYYDVTGAFVSPFASSDGKVTQMGLALETDGRKEVIRFTPTRFTIWEAESRGYKEALKAIKSAWGDRPWVTEAETFSREEASSMIDEARKPFLPFFAIVLLVASAAPILWALTRLGLDVPVALPISVIPMFAVMLQSAWQSKKRHAVLDRLSKAAELARGQA